MRENRPSGSEGGVAMSHSYPYRLFVRAIVDQQSERDSLIVRHRLSPRVPRRSAAPVRRSTRGYSPTPLRGVQGQIWLPIFAGGTISPPVKNRQP